jgi:hypothetical protein
MTTSRTLILSAVLTFALPSAQAMAATCTPDTNGNSVGDGWGASWSFGPTTSRIIHARTTIIPGRLPPMANVGPLFLWPGMSNPTSDLIQTTMDAWGGTENLSYCNSASSGGLPTQWCVEASVFGSGGQTNGPTVAIDATDQVTIDYELGSDNETWTQTVTSKNLGKVVSTLTSKSGEMPNGGFGFATEADSCSFTIDTQYYLCSEIDLFAADPHFDETGVGGVGAQTGNTGEGSGIGTAQNIHTPDNGKTWLVDLITLPAMKPQGTQAPPPAVDCETDGGASSGDAGSTGSGGSGGSGGTDGGAGGSGATPDAAGFGGSGGSAGGGGAGGSGATADAGGSGSGGPAGSGGADGSGIVGGADGGGSNESPSGQSGGCGCRTAVSRELPGGVLVGLGLVAALATLGRRRPSRRSTLRASSRLRRVQRARLPSNRS